MSKGRHGIRCKWVYKWYTSLASNWNQYKWCLSACLWAVLISCVGCFSLSLWSVLGLSAMLFNYTSDKSGGGYWVGLNKLCKEKTAWFKWYSTPFLHWLFHYGSCMLMLYGAMSPLTNVPGLHAACDRVLVGLVNKWGTAVHEPASLLTNSTCLLNCRSIFKPERSQQKGVREFW